jgi:protein SCO1/2
MSAAVKDSRPGPIGRFIARPVFWISAVLLMCLASLAMAVVRKLPSPPPVMLELPRFELTSDKGVPFGSDQLRGRVWVANFIFTSCPVACPKLMEKMAEIQHRTRNAAEAVHLVSFSVDPENDTPEKLAEYGRRFKASPYRWTLLTGDLKQIEATVIKGFKLAMGKEADNLFQIFHSERFVLIDGAGKIRGYYDADKAGIDALIRDISLVLNVR